MRLKLTLQVQRGGNGGDIPINYQYQLRSAIFKILSASDPNFSLWLHDYGYNQKGKRFKMFTFSNLIVPCVIDNSGKRLIPKRDKALLYIGFADEHVSKTFLKGAFLNETIRIADKHSGMEFKIVEIQMLRPLEYHPDKIFETLSPICVSCRNESGKMDYLSPEDSRYEQGLLTGLISRYSALYGHPYEEEKYCRIEIIGQIKSRLITIKEGSPEQTRVRGYSYRFKIDLPPELMEIAYNGGLGEKGSMGFGMIG